VGAACAEEVRSDAVEGYTRPLSKDEATAIVDAILTSLAEDGFREVEVLDGRFKVELLADGRFAIVQVEDEGAQVALIKGETLFHKPHPPAKGD